MSMLAQPQQWEHGTGSTVITSPSFPHQLPGARARPGLGGGQKMIPRSAVSRPLTVRLLHGALPAAAHSSSSPDADTATLTTMI